ncbi:MAG TPA: D-alanine--D-alanine ligase [bacterium]|nr:D-alanine--D-alanine ligase [bacterium]
MKNQKKRIAVLFGGRSAEHEVSLTSAVAVLANLDREKYDILPVRISREGRWILIEDSGILSSVPGMENAEGPAVMAGDPTLGGFLRVGDGSVIPVDAVFPVLHGPFGEDGTVQGLLALSGLACVGAGVLGSALGMDKVLMKQMFIQNDLPTPDFIWFTRSAWEKESDAILRGVRSEIGFPCFVKPANLGSSVGITQVKSEEALGAAVETAGRYDRKVLVEKAVGARELECAVLGNDRPEASVVGEIIPSNEFYDYAAKYVDDASEIVIPADIPSDVADRARLWSVMAFKALDCAGMARVDFLYERGSGHLFVNEINTIPGFTPISMYPKLWETSGLPYSRLLDRLIELAMERHRETESTVFQKQ